MSELYLSVIIPAYDEEKRLGASLEAIADYLGRQSYASEIIAVNDGSTDGTLEVLHSFQVKYPAIRIISYPNNRGKGYAVRQGILSAKGLYTLFTDADLNTPMEEVKKLFTAINGGADVAIGSRMAPGAAKIVRRPWIRRIGSKGLNLAIRLLAVPGIGDTQCGFKLFKAEAGRDIFGRSFLERFSFDVEILYLARKLGYSVAEIPIAWFYRGGSKVRPFQDGLRFLKDIIKIRTHDYHVSAKPRSIG